MISTQIFYYFFVLGISKLPVLCMFRLFYVVLRVLEGMLLWYWKNFFISMVIFLFISVFWVRDMWRESVFRGYFFLLNILNIKFIMICFIFSEVLLFFSFFWTGLNILLNNEFLLGFEWPPIFIFFIQVFRIPLLNTLLLVISRVLLTRFHEIVLIGKLNLKYLLVRIFLGVYFFILQNVEYKIARFSMPDNILGSSFFVFTGFHGGHVFLGGVFLFWIFVFFKNISFFRLVAAEMRIWYWHFVDVVWLFLFSIFYWWGA